jgi:hypothetical protein
MLWDFCFRAGSGQGAAIGGLTTAAGLCSRRHVAEDSDLFLEEAAVLIKELEARREMIWNQEQLVAYEVAKVVIPKPKVTVWMIMLPLLFLFFLHDLKKFKTGITDFAQGFLKNKKTALDLTFNATREGIPVEAKLAQFAAEAWPAPADQNELHEKQRREIACLMNHYQRLLTGSGKSYAALIKNVYPSAPKYQIFLDTLFELESGVLKAVLQSTPTDGNAHEIAKLMQTATRQMRQRERDRIFPV